ncbi:hypothetical protein F4677DRAFT_459811 [Hypoxylon crocopeplum]|nr:hypothetical protein F4677DRAFT_459811 [Hypoxylon crocopeplum]
MRRQRANNAALNNTTTTVADVWGLDTSKEEVPKANRAVFIPHENRDFDSTFEETLKHFVKHKSLGDNKFDFGTGWSIHPDVMITAGYNVFIRRTNGRSASKIIAYTGRKDASSISDPSTEARKAKQVVTASQYLLNLSFVAHALRRCRDPGPHYGCAGPAVTVPVIVRSIQPAQLEEHFDNGGNFINDGNNI